MLYYNQLKKTRIENHMWPHKALNLNKNVKNMSKIPILWKLTHIYIYIWVNFHRMGILLIFLTFLFKLRALCGHIWFSILVFFN